jgi:3-oxoacyl-[acyl-carrier protein] reductase
LPKKLKGMGVAANAVAPGPVATVMFFEGKSEETIKRIVDACSLGQFGEAKDVTHLV